jgi:hypothetical protein
MVDPSIDYHRVPPSSILSSRVLSDHSTAEVEAGYKVTHPNGRTRTLSEGYTGLAAPDPKPANREHTGLT